MMLQIDHRESHDVDIFLHYAQFLPFLAPKLHDFEFEIRPSDTEEMGPVFSNWHSTGSERSTLSSGGR